MSTPPRLTVGLPVYNGAHYLAESVEALLGQTYADFELIISDNASTDATADICRQYQQQDARVRYVRQPRNIGCASNHNYLVHEARGELFKWASDDDLYSRDLLRRCVEALDEHPDVILAHSWTAVIDSAGNVTKQLIYQLATDSPHAPERFRSMLFDRGSDDDGGVIRTAVLRRTALNGSYYRADRTLTAELALDGRFCHVPDWLYFRRDHPDRAERMLPDTRAWCANLDPARANRLRHPAARLYAEYVGGYVSAIRRSPLRPADRLQCHRYLAQWLVSRVFLAGGKRAKPPAEAAWPVISLEAVVPGWERRAR